MTTTSTDYAEKETKLVYIVINNLVLTTRTFENDNELVNTVTEFMFLKLQIQYIL